MHLIFYGFIMVLVVTMLITIIIYTSVVVGWCGFSARLPHPSPSRASEEKSNGSLSQYLASSFRYEKGIENAEADSEPVECAVCLSGFNDGDNVCQLPRCKHSFHYPCIDMWLYSHSDCPLCRAPVDRIDSGRKSLTSTIEENSREVLLDIRILS